MGNIFKKFPRPAEINFPAVQKKIGIFLYVHEQVEVRKNLLPFFVY